MAIFSRVVVILAFCALVWLLGFPVYVDCLAFLLCGVTGAIVSRSKTLLLVCSLLFSVAVAELAARALMRHSMEEVFYRPDEKYAGASRYQPDVDEIFAVPHGDLIALDPFLTRSIAQPRRIRFKTDSLGYRNDADYASQPFILVGDSLVAGSGNAQDELLANVLSRDFGIESYAVAFPTDPSGYFKMVEELTRQLRARFKVILFVFEGNDFHGPGRGLAKPSRYDALKLRAVRALHSTFLTASFNLIRRSERHLFPRLDSATEVYQVGARPMAFYGSYIDKAMANALKFEPGTPSSEVMETIHCVVFVPTKFRVYFSLLSDARGRRLPSPPPGYLALLSFFGGHDIPVIDLTGSLVESATELLANEQYVFWRDDTHWNVHGVRVAASEVASFLKDERSVVGR